MLDEDNSMNSHDNREPNKIADAANVSSDQAPDRPNASAEPVAQPPPATSRRAAGRPAGPPAAMGHDLFSPPAPTDTPGKQTPAPATDQPGRGQREVSGATGDGPATDNRATNNKVGADTMSQSRAHGAATEHDSTQSPAPVDSASAALSTPTESSEKESSRGGSQSGAPAADSDEMSAAPGKSNRPSVGLTFQAPPTTVLPRREHGPDDSGDHGRATDEATGTDATDDSSRTSDNDDADSDNGGSRRRRRGRGGRRRRKGDNDTNNGNSSSDDTSNSESSETSGQNTGSKNTDGQNTGSKNADNKNTDGKNTPASRDKGTSADNNDGADSADETDDDNSDGDNGDSQDGGNGRVRRRRRRRTGEDAESSDDDPENTVVKVREPRSDDEEISSVTGSTRLEAKKQRRREGREANRRRAPIVSEAEFLARRESVERVMAVRQQDDLAQIGVLEDDVLVEHYVARESQTSLIGNVYLGVVQNVLPSMEAAFIDIGKGRNAVIYAGEVDWSTLNQGKQRKIEEVLEPGQSTLVQVTKDPIGQKGARLTSQISLAGRFLVFVPEGNTHGISRKLPDTERSRLKALLKQVLPDDTGVIVRTAAEGATEEQLTRDVTALTARWDDINKKIEDTQGVKNPTPQSLYTEPDLMIKVVRDLFNEDFSKLVVQGNEAWDSVSAYIQHVAPDLMERLDRYTPGDDDSDDLFEAFRVDEQIVKALDRKVFLPSGGSLVIDRTEAMTVVDVNTGKFTGSGGNLEETVTKNNLEAAEEIVRQLRLRDLGGIIVIDFIDMVLESNRELVLRRLIECLGRDRTRHQVAEVTSLGLVQMTRKRIGTGLLEAFADECEHCSGRGVIVHSEPIEPKKHDDQQRGRRGGRKRGGQQDNGQQRGSNNRGGSSSNDNKETTGKTKNGKNHKDDSRQSGKPQSDKPQSGRSQDGKSQDSKQHGQDHES